jgi:hypothetical protein
MPVIHEEQVHVYAAIPARPAFLQDFRDGCRNPLPPFDWKTGGYPASNRMEQPMQYLLLIYSNEAEYDARPQAEVAATMNDYGTFTQGIVQSGNYKGGERLRPVSSATTVRVRDGKTLTTDGPFAETREQLGGYYLIDAKNLDEATAIAAKCPGARRGSVEVRPIWAMGEP